MARDINDVKKVLDRTPVWMTDLTKINFYLEHPLQVKIFNLWNDDKMSPLDNQSEECKNFVISVIET
jgi:hypothetical protein